MNCKAYLPDVFNAKIFLSRFVTSRFKILLNDLFVALYLDYSFPFQTTTQFSYFFCVLSDFYLILLNCQCFFRFSFHLFNATDRC
jgi:hypothetical protein